MTKPDLNPEDILRARYQDSFHDCHLEKMPYNAKDHNCERTTHLMREIKQ